MKRRLVRIISALLPVVITLQVFGGTLSTAQAAPATPVPSTRTVKIMTQNMDNGTDFGLVLGATSLSQFVAGVTATYQEAQASNIPERAQAVAREIGAQHPDLVSLQEAGVWRTGPAGQPPATTVKYDALQSLLDALQQQGLSYAPVAVQNEFDLEAPSTLGVDVRYTDRDVILARTGDDAPELSNVQQQHFSTTLTLPTVLGPQVTVLRGWQAVDVHIRGRFFRFVATHLEEASASVQVAQGNELLQGPGNTTLPVVFAGDFNSAAAGGPHQSPTYGNLIAAGLVDSWNVANPSDPGYTWPLHGEDPFTASSTPTERIDLVLFRGGFGTSGVQLVGNSPADLTPSGLWPADHAGVVATLQLP